MRVKDRYREELRRDQEIVYADMELRPLLVGDYEIYTGAKPSMELMLASLPPAIARLDWFSALDKLDREAAERGVPSDFANSILLLLARAMRLESFAEDGRQYYPIRILRDSENGDPKAVFINRPKGGPILLRTGDMDTVREILAAQNGYEIPDENWNPDLVRAAAFTKAQKQNGLHFDLDTLVASVAHQAGVRQKEIWDWTIREFQAQMEAIDRDLNYRIFAQAEMSGFVQFKKGNPYPSWKFDRDSDMPGDFKSISDLDAGANGLLGAPTTQEKE